MYSKKKGTWAEIKRSYAPNIAISLENAADQQASPMDKRIEVDINDREVSEMSCGGPPRRSACLPIEDHQSKKSRKTSPVGLSRSSLFELPTIGEDYH
ncbi:hypothetical protein PG995_005866 [Apiospora arundinis]